MSDKKNKIILLQGVFDPVIFDKLHKKNIDEVFVLEGRPGLEAAKQSCPELLRRRVKPTLIADNMAGFLFYQKLVKEVWMSYGEKDKQGALCRVGGLILGVLGKRHKVPVYAYPNRQNLRLMGWSNELSYFNGTRVAPSGVKGYVPLAEWVPHKYIDKIYE